jgi:hypothetical protein
MFHAKLYSNKAKTKGIIGFNLTVFELWTGHVISPNSNQDSIENNSK